MIEDFLTEYTKKIVKNPERVRVSKEKTTDGYDFVIFAATEDIGKIVGKDGKMIASIKAFISGCKAKNGLNYKVMAKAIHEEQYSK
ncbi:KH domain-containing protein [Helicobacter anatolicus]|uniref:KH domain-containing protein n=1 Tax=Helicobacter anatolicus TaxID=2905874 RepID=UPI001E49AD92|nr:KH domain-containing protein [Helicobacter anatolicus]MCE3037780.1 KH domain-containing protein [Helicobacter anatolicus]